MSRFQRLPIFVSLEESVYSHRIDTSEYNEIRQHNLFREALLGCARHSATDNVDDPHSGWLMPEAEFFLGDSTATTQLTLQATSFKYVLINGLLYTVYIYINIKKMFTTSEPAIRPYSLQLTRAVEEEANSRIIHGDSENHSSSSHLCITNTSVVDGP